MQGEYSEGTTEVTAAGVDTGELAESLELGRETYSLSKFMWHIRVFLFLSGVCTT